MPVVAPAILAGAVWAGTEMAELARGRTDDELVRLLATDVVLTQQAQIGRMRGWLDVWDETPTSAAAPMSWMGHGDPAMRGMATLTRSTTSPACPGGTSTHGSSC